MSVDKIATETSYLVNAMSFSWGAMTFNNWMMLISVLAGIGTGIGNWYYKRKEYIRRCEMHELKKELSKGKQANGLVNG